MIRHQPLYKGIKVALSVVFCVVFLEIIVCALVYPYSSCIQLTFAMYIIYVERVVVLTTRST
jgi:hypothetical protein